MSTNSTMPINCSFEEVDRLMTVLELVIYVPIFVLGLILNVLALAVFCVMLRKWTESTIYMTNLALMDLLLLLLLPFKMHATNHRWSAQHRLLCSFLETMYFVGLYGSIYIIVCIAVDRWVAIKHPFIAKQHRSPRAALMACVGVWVLVLVSISPVYGFRQADDRDFHCFHGFSDNGWSPVVISCVLLFGFLGPAFVLVGCSVQIVRSLRKSTSTMGPAQQQAYTRIIYSSLCAFLLPFTPFHLAILLQFLVRHDVIEDCRAKTSISLFLQVSLSLANITCFLDAVCYYFIAREVRNSPQHFRTRTLSQSNSNHHTRSRLAS